MMMRIISFSKTKHPLTPGEGRVRVLNRVTRSLGITLLLALTHSSYSQIGSLPGSFTRLGFGARGQAMGNSMSAVTNGIIAPYYNPALAAYQIGHVLNGNYSLLSLDRKLNHISYTQNLSLRKKGANHFSDDPDLQSIAGFSVGWINAGDANIDGRDDDGFKTGTLGVFENQFYFTLSNRFTDRLAIGLNFKFYYSGFNVFSVNQPASVTSSGFGLDIGVLYQLTEQVSVALVVQELVTKYRWDTSTLYGPERGKTTEYPFIRLYRAGAAYQLPDTTALVSCELEYTSEKTMTARIGAEVKLIPQFTLRAGVDKLRLSDSGLKPKPTVGFTVTQLLGIFSPSVSYAIIFEPVAPSSTHVVSVALNF